MGVGCVGQSPLSARLTCRPACVWPCDTACDRRAESPPARIGLQAANGHAPQQPFITLPPVDAKPPSFSLPFGPATGAAGVRNCCEHLIIKVCQCQRLPVLDTSRRAMNPLPCSCVP